MNCEYYCLFVDWVRQNIGQCHTFLPKHFLSCCMFEDVAGAVASIKHYHIVIAYQATIQNLISNTQWYFVFSVSKFDVQSKAHSTLAWNGYFHFSSIQWSSMLVTACLALCGAWLCIDRQQQQRLHYWRLHFVRRWGWQHRHSRTVRLFRTMLIVSVVACVAEGPTKDR